jgi:hypothetical protein
MQCGGDNEERPQAYTKYVEDAPQLGNTAMRQKQTKQKALALPGLLLSAT